MSHMEFTKTIKDEAELKATLISLSEDGQAWTYIIRPFSHETTFISFKNPSSVPDELHDLSRNMIAWNGKIRPFTKAACIRESNRGLRRD